MPAKRKSVVASAAAKKARVDVVAAISKTEVLPLDLRKLFSTALPIVLEANKVDRHAFEAEVVKEAEKSLGKMKVDLQSKHKEAVQKQGQVTSGAERTRRDKAKAELETKLAAAKTHVQAKTAEQQAARTAVSNAKNTVKETTQAAAKVDADTRKVETAKNALAQAVSTEMEVLRTEGRRTPLGKKAAKVVAGMGKTYGLGPTLQSSFLEACKNSGAARTDFENTTFSTLVAKLDQHHVAVTQKLEAAQAESRQKAAAVEGSKAALASAEESCQKAEEAVQGADTEKKQIESLLRQATSACISIWDDMKDACDATDKLAADIKSFDEDLMVKFVGLKNKEPEPEPVEEAPAEAAPAEAPPAEAPAA